MKTASELIEALEEGLVLTDAQARLIKEYTNGLKALAKEAESYRKSLIKDIERYSLIVMPKVNSKNLVEGCENMSLEKLKHLREDMQKQSFETVPARTQLAKSVNTQAENNKDFKI